MENIERQARAAAVSGKTVSGVLLLRLIPTASSGPRASPDSKESLFPPESEIREVEIGVRRMDGKKALERL